MVSKTLLETIFPSVIVENFDIVSIQHDSKAEELHIHLDEKKTIPVEPFYRDEVMTIYTPLPIFNSVHGGYLALPLCTAIINTPLLWHIFVHGGRHFWPPCTDCPVINRPYRKPPNLFLHLIQIHRLYLSNRHFYGYGSVNPNGVHKAAPFHRHNLVNPNSVHKTTCFIDCVFIILTLFIK